MPEFKAGRGVWTKLCIQCGAPFIKTARVQKKCPRCVELNTGKRGKYVRKR